MAAAQRAADLIVTRMFAYLAGGTDRT
jgi:hypothetical protein